METGKINPKTRDATEKLREELKKLVPAAFSEGRLDPAALAQLIGETAPNPQEPFRLRWPGKDQALEQLRQIHALALDPRPEKSIDFDRAPHALVVGENLQTLKTLAQNYHRAVKMIYIDPPYNTGNDHFLYADDFHDSAAEHERKDGTRDEDGTRIRFRKNSRDNGRFHSNWLNFIYPRLFIARDLLKDDGVIFISIDDNEVHNLRHVMDEIFGEENFVGEIVWKGKGGGADAKFLVKTFEYILFYAKNKDNFTIGEMDKENEVFPKFDSERNRKYKIQLARKWGSNSKRTDRPNLFYAVSAPDGTDVFPLLPGGIEGCWRWSKDRMNKEIESGNVEFLKTENGWTVYEKIYEPVKGESNTRKYSDLIDNVGTTASGTRELMNLFGERVFDYPKPIALIKRLIGIAGVTESDIIFDFFAGSGTTGHAVMELNAEDGGDRRFVLVQAPEMNGESATVQGAGFAHIGEVCAERLRRAARAVGAFTPPTPPLTGGEFENYTPPLDKGGAGGVNGPGQGGVNHPGGAGFRYYELGPSHLKAWTAPADADELVRQAELYVEGAEPGTEPAELAWELALKSGARPPLDVPFSAQTVEGAKIYRYGTATVVLDAPSGDKRAFWERALAGTQTLVVWDAAFGGDDAGLTNLAMECAARGIKLETP